MHTLYVPIYVLYFTYEREMLLPVFIVKSYAPEIGDIKSGALF